MRNSDEYLIMLKTESSTKHKQKLNEQVKKKKKKFLWKKEEKLNRVIYPHCGPLVY